MTWASDGTARAATIRPGAKLTTRQWGDLVDRWNHLSPEERRQAAAPCRAHGHQWVTTPVGDCCRVCMRYR